MGKFQLERFGLTVTAPDNAAPVIGQLEEGILALLQFAHDPVGCLDTVIKAEGSGPFCAVAVAAKAHIFSTVIIELDVSPLRDLVADKDKRAAYEQWELNFIEAALEAIDYKFEACIAKSEAALLATPNDIFTLRTMWITCFHCGRYDRMLYSLIGIVESFRKLPEMAIVLPYVMGMCAFALEENGRLDAAQLLAEEAIRRVDALNADGAKVCGEPLVHPYAMHVLCHCYLERHQPQEGLDAIARLSPDLWQKGKHLVVHLWWHLCLFHSDLGENDKALAIYDEKMLPDVNKDDPYSLSDASGLLFRLYVDGIIDSNDGRLPPLMEKWTKYCPPEPTVPRDFFKFSFFSYNLFAMMTMMGGDANKEFAVRCANGFPAVLSANADLRGMQAVGAVVQSTSTYLCGDLTAARDALSVSRPLWPTMGGSGGQRDILNRWELHLQQKAAAGGDPASALILAAAKERMKSLQFVFPKNPHFSFVAKRL